MEGKKIGIIAGSGGLPHEVVKVLHKRGQDFVVIFLDVVAGFADDLSDGQYRKIAIGQVGKIFSFLRENGVEEVLMVGKVVKPKFSGIKVDLTGARLLAKITKNKLLGDNTIFKTIISFINENSFEVIGTKDLDLPLHFSVGFYGAAENRDAILSDVLIARSLLSKISTFDVGQSLVIQGGRIIGIEAAEGTDQLLKRCDTFIDTKAKKAALLVKTSKEEQELRVDLPTVGLDTINHLIDLGYGGIAIEAKNTIILNQDEILERLDGQKFFIYAY